MAGAVADETIIAIRAEVDRAVSEFRKVQGEISGVEKSAKSSQKATDSAVTSLGAYARRLLIAVGAVKGIMQGIDFNAFIESQQLAFSVMLKDTDLAIEKMDEFRTMALSLPITFREVAAGARQLLAYGIPEKDLTETLGMLGDITRALSIPMGDLIYLYGTLRTQGRAYARDLMQFGMRGIPIYESLSEVMQVPVDRIRDMTKAGEVGFYEVEKAFKMMTTEGGKFGGLMEKSMDTFSGMMVSFKNLIDMSLGAITEGIFQSIKDVIPTITMMLKDNMDSFREFGEIIGKAFSFLLNALVGVVSWLAKLDKATKSFIALLIGAGGLVVAVQTVMKVVNSLFGLSLSIFSPAGAVFAAVSLLAVSIAAVVGKMKQAEEEARRIHESAMEMLQDERVNFLKEGDWELIPGMTQEISDAAQLNKKYEEAIHLAETMVRLKEMMEKGQQGPSFVERMFALPGIIKTLADRLQYVNKWLEDYPNKIGDLLEFQHNNLSGFMLSNAFDKALSKVRESIQDSSLKGLFDEMVVGIRQSTLQIEELSKRREELLNAGASFETLRKIDNQIASIMTQFQTEYQPIMQDIIATMQGSGEAAERLADRLLKAFQDDQSLDQVKHWWDWLSERLNVALSDFDFVSDSGDLKYSGKVAAEAYIEGFTGNLEDARILSSLVEDEGKYYAEIAKRQMDDIFGILVDMFGQASREQISPEEWFKTADESVKALVKEYMRLRGIVESVKKEGKDWLDEWMKGFEKLVDQYNEFLAVFVRDEKGQITAVIDFQREIAQRNARRTLDENMENYNLIREKIESVYGLELETKEELYAYVRRMIDEQYDYEIEKAKEADRLRSMNLAAEFAVYRSTVGSFEARKEAVEQEYNIRKMIAQTMEEGYERQIALLEAEKKYTEDTAAIVAEQIQAKAREAHVEVMKAEYAMNTASSFREQLDLAEKLYMQQVKELSLTSDLNELDVKQMELELNHAKLINDMYQKRYDILMQGDQEYWDQARRNIAQAQSEGNTGRALAGQAGLAAQGTEIGNMISGGDPLLAIVDAISTAVMNIENLNAVLNPFTTIMEGMVSVIEPFVNSFLAPFVDNFKFIGALFGAFSAILVAVNIPLQVLRIAFGILAEVIKWFYNRVMLPVGNAIIDAINTVVTKINETLKTNIALIDRLRPLIDNIEEYSDALREQADSLKDTLSFLERKLKDVVDAQVDSLQDLYEVGAISSTEYQSQVNDIMAEWGPYFQSAAEQMFGDLNDPQSIVDAILEVRKQLESVNSQLEAIGEDSIGTGKTVKPMGLVGHTLAMLDKYSFASGSSSIPSDMNASIHRGEMIIPSSFASAIRRGDITIGGPGGSGGASVNIYVGGSVIEERNLARSIADVIEQERSRGHM